MHLQIDLDDTVLAHYTTHLKLLERGKEKEKEKFRGLFPDFPSTVCQNEASHKSQCP